MRVTGVDIHASNSNKVMSLSFKDPTSQSTYIAKEIVGLDADDITSKFYGSNVLSDKYYDLSLPKRDIVVKVALNPNYAENNTYSMLRDELYKLISSSRTGAVQLQFKDGLTTVAAISGFVTKLESPQFTKSPEVQLTINCSDPMLKAMTPVEVDVTGLDPFATVITDDKSTAPHGFRFGVSIGGTGGTIKFFIKDATVPTWFFEVDLSEGSLSPFVSGDKIQFSSEHNDRHLYLVRGASTYHLVDRIIPGSIWPILFPGDNTFVCSNLVSWDYITYYPTYWGV